jgi:formate hydrogenlyase subunit 6/NADH:ubiquinone oxidoreductase subunit I
MMNILHILSQNFGHGSRTRQPNDAVPYPSGFRGKLVHNVDLCTACGTCAYACSPSAITLDESDKAVVHWKYTEDRCTFCGFCIQYCPTQALSFVEESPSPLSERSQHYINHDVVLKPCPQCGEPVRVIPEMTLHQLYGDPLPKDIAESMSLCERCRQKLISKRFLSALVGKGGTHDA